MKHPLLAYDEKDTRKEVLFLLERLAPAVRLAWLRWACQQAVLRGTTTNHPCVPPYHTGNALECYFDFFLLVANFKIDADAALNQLVRVARKHGRWLR